MCKLYGEKTDRRVISTFYNWITSIVKFYNTVGNNTFAYLHKIMIKLKIIHVYIFYISAFYSLQHQPDIVYYNEYFTLSSLSSFLTRIPCIFYHERHIILCLYLIVFHITFLIPLLLFLYKGFCVSIYGIFRFHPHYNGTRQYAFVLHSSSKYQ